MSPHPSSPAGPPYPRRWLLAGSLVASAVLLTVGLILVLATRSNGLVALGAGAVIAAWFTLVSVALVMRARARSAASRQELQGIRRDIDETRKALSAKVDEERAKESRHEYHQEQSLRRIEDHVRRLQVRHELAAPTFGAEAGIDVLFATSNGAGLGHISRLLAVSRHLPDSRSFEFLTLSTAYRQVASLGVTMHYFPSSDAVQESPQAWNPVFRSYFARLLHEVRPRVVVFDGTWVYTGITDVCRSLGIAVVWMQRGLWKPEVDAASAQRHDVAKVADHVIIPGDYAGREVVESGPGVEPRYVDPVVMTSRRDLLSREQACRHLGLDPAGRFVLLNLGGGAISDPDSLAHSALAILREESPELTAVQVVSPLAEASDPVSGLIRVSAYPVMQAARAFEYTIAAAGYNSVQESIGLGLPGIFVPNARTRTDDQVRRAREVSARGLCLAAENETELRAAIAALADPSSRHELRDRLFSLDEPEGASASARILEDLIDREAWPQRAETVRGVDEQRD